MSAEEVVRGAKLYRRNTYPAIDPAQPELSTKGKSAVVTGAGQGVGASIARSLARSGISFLALVGRRLGPLNSVAEEIGKLGPDTKVFTYVVDIVDEDAVKTGFARFAADIGGRAIDILIANAGYMADLGMIADVDPKDWWSGFEINIKGNFHLMRAYVRHSPTDGSGAVIHVATSSIHGPYMPNFSSYRVSKAGATKLFDIFAHEHPELFVLQVHPGLIGGTTMHSKFAHTTEGFDFDDERLGSDFIIWSLSPQAKFLNGRFVWANWDVDELLAKKKEIVQDPSMYTIGLLGW
ncbi:hypothetical protein F5B20DRAFT_53264 [Whalleya microplaca]|nr:hypothetical protein F5B20DRAFT_53264 [Whalleya microplaca]